MYPSEAARRCWEQLLGSLPGRSEGSKAVGQLKGENPGLSRSPMRLSAKDSGGKNHMAASGAALAPGAHPITHSAIPAVLHRGREHHAPRHGSCVRGCCEAAAASACCGALPLLARLARLFPPSAEPSTFIFMFPSLIRSTLPLQSNERAELKQTQSVREGPGKDVWGHCKGTCSTLMQNQDSFGSQHSLSPHPLPHTYPHGTPHHSRG